MNFNLKGFVYALTNCNAGNHYDKLASEFPKQRLGNSTFKRNVEFSHIFNLVCIASNIDHYTMPKSKTQIFYLQSGGLKEVSRHETSLILPQILHSLDFLS